MAADAAAAAGGAADAAARLKQHLRHAGLNSLRSTQTGVELGAAAMAPIPIRSAAKSARHDDRRRDDGQYRDGRRDGRADGQYRDGRSEGYRDGSRNGTWWEGGRDRRSNDDWRRDRRGDGRQDYRGDHRRWDRDWRRDRRYDWNSYRRYNRDNFSIGLYYAPYRNYSYSRLSIGYFLDSLFLSNRYWINDPWQYRLPDVYGPYRWVRYYNDVVLVDTYTGEVVDVIHDFFW